MEAENQEPEVAAPEAEKPAEKEPKEKKPRAPRKPKEKPPVEAPRTGLDDGPDLFAPEPGTPASEPEDRELDSPNAELQAELDAAQEVFADETPFEIKSEMRELAQLANDAEMSAEIASLLAAIEQLGTKHKDAAVAAHNRGIASDFNTLISCARQIAKRIAGVQYWNLR